MLRTRIIPIIQIKKRTLVKTVKYKNERYLGDPLNAIKILNEKRVDELIIIDIDASKNNTPIDFEFISELCTECFMPVGYGGGIKTMEDIRKLFSIGIEKIILNSLIIENPEIVKKAVDQYGAQSIIGSIDLKKHWFSKKTYPYINSGNKQIKSSITEYLQKLLNIGVGEIIINDLDREGTFLGYNLDLIKKIKNIKSHIPIIFNGGANSLQDFIDAKINGIDALAAASYFSLLKPHYALLITYLSEEEIKVINEIN